MTKPDTGGRGEGRAATPEQCRQAIMFGTFVRRTAAGVSIYEYRGETYVIGAGDERESRAALQAQGDER